MLFSLRPQTVFEFDDSISLHGFFHCWFTFWFCGNVCPITPMSRTVERRSRVAQPGCCSAKDDFHYILGCFPDQKEKLENMLECERWYRPKGRLGGYIANVQRDGMEEEWRRKIAEWTFRVSISTM